MFLNTRLELDPVEKRCLETVDAVCRWHSLSDRNESSFEVPKRCAPIEVALCSRPHSTYFINAAAKVPGNESSSPHSAYVWHHVVCTEKTTALHPPPPPLFTKNPQSLPTPPLLRFLPQKKTPILPQHRLCSYHINHNRYQSLPSTPPPPS